MMNPERYENICLECLERLLLPDSVSSQPGRIRSSLLGQKDGSGEL